MLFRADCQATRRAVSEIHCPSESFGLTAAATWRAGELRERRGLYSFRIRCRGRLVCDVKLQVPGRHNVTNALAAAALASHCGACASSIRAGLERFAGLERRLQVIAERDEIAIVDDYAHHPTAVAATLATVRQMFPGRRMWCVFEPHQASRLRNLLQEFAHSLQNADKIMVTEVCRARETAGSASDVSAAHLAARITELGGQAQYLASRDEIEDHLKQALRPGDVLVTVGAGEIGKVAHGLGQRLRTFCKAG
jgi:UDP-N-acetylmuramate--alanine ligase